MAKIDCPWLLTPVCIERTIVTSSTISAKCGSSSETSAPHCPCLANFQGQPSTLALACAELSYLISPGKLLPSSLFSSGFGSSRSRWLGPPCMNSEIIARARGSNCGFLGSKSNVCGSNSGRSGAASSLSSFNSQASATEPMPSALVAKKWRRLGAPLCENPGKGTMFSLPYVGESRKQQLSRRVVSPHTEIDSRSTAPDTNWPAQAASDWLRCLSCRRADSFENVPSARR